MLRALERHQRVVYFEHLGDRQNALCSVGAYAIPIESAELVAGQAASTINTLSGGADSRFWAWGGVLHARERFVDREHVGDVLCAVNTEAVVRDAANRGANAVSAAC